MTWVSARLGLSPPFQRRTGMNSKVAAVTNVGMGTGGSACAAFSEAHRYEMNVAAG